MFNFYGPLNVSLETPVGNWTHGIVGEHTTFKLLWGKQRGVDGKRGEVEKPTDFARVTLKSNPSTTYKASGEGVGGEGSGERERGREE